MWVECVPNFSEGRRKDVLEALMAAAAVPGARVLGLSADPDHNRAVLTLAGDAQAVLEGVFRASRVAVAEIDLRTHRGTHPRMGAVDVVPFVPLGATPMSACVELARRLGRRLAEELQLPVYLYERAATRPDRQNLADVRRPQFEGLTAWLSDPSHQPDFGPPRPHPTAGAVAVGARPPLVAFNVFLETQDVEVAKRVARAVRGSSGGLRGVKALAMDTVTRGRVQVSMNLVDPGRTGLATALDMVRREAARYGVAVTGTELVGFVPLDALVQAARYTLQLHDLDRDHVLEWALLAPDGRPVVEGVGEDADDERDQGPGR
jgi:glutamate formiminotransferase